MLKRLEITQPSSDLIEFMNIGWFCFSLNGEILGANSVILKLLDYPDPSTFCKANAWIIFAEASTRAHIQNSLKIHQNLRELKAKLRHRDGMLLSAYIDIFVRPAVDGSGQQLVDCLVNFAPNEIERRLREFEQLQMGAKRQRRFAEALGRMIFSASALQSLPALLNLICREAATSLEIASSQMWLLQDEVLVCVAEDGLKPIGMVGLRMHLSDTENLMVKVVKSQTQVLNLNMDTNGGVIHPQLTDLLNVHSLLVAPLSQTARVLGVFVLVNMGGKQPVESEDLEFLLQLGTQATIVVDNAGLFRDLKVANANLAQSYDATLMGWAKALELRDQETKGHTERVVELSLKLAREFGLNQEELTNVYRGALLHDIGKMGIPDKILLKPGPLNAGEREIMRQHPVLAYEMLKPIDYLSSSLDIPYYHHERWDGTGYPHGLRGEEIPRSARIFAVIDVWDALSYDRPYRKAWPVSKVLRKIRSEAGKHFDPQVVEKFLALWQRENK